ncbi:Retinol dehydrogenase 11 [Phytophthora citrophthora]|uniref:Retinol dehydrogenase 11 n=1 Tax=Phytophthora citrophthora TaxID=4793 RepID=A0AAD9GA21_9STRA|nr:Retinol dehydrogenase 11 [Phytophthora citrophthora]
MGAAGSRSPVPDNWDASRIPSQKGKLAVVTGGNSGIGYETALQLARNGAHVVLACRDEERGRAAETKIQETLASSVNAGSVEFMQLDVSDLSSVKQFAERFKETHNRLDLLINNAGIMGGAYAKTVDGYERQFATNHLGHFAMTAQLFDLVKESTPARIVNVSSMVHRNAFWTFDEDHIMANSERTYSQWLNYANTKLCNILFTFELDRRMKAAGVEGITAVACHPGTTSTNLLTAPSTANSNWMWSMAFKLWSLMPRQTIEMGALPTLYAATGKEVEGGDFFGPKHLNAMFGYPVRETSSKMSQSTTAATKLWTLSERLAHLSFDIKK